MFLSLFARAHELFEPYQWRMYFASVIGRTGLRNPFGARRSLVLPTGRSVLLAKNDSKARALLVNVQVTGGFTRFASSPSIGATDIIIDPNAITAPTAGDIFVLGPDDQLYAQSAGPSRAVVGQEWY